MSTDWYYRFSAELRPDLAALDIDALVARAPGRLSEVTFPTYPRIGELDAYAPVLGPGIGLDVEPFRGFTGAGTLDGRLRLAIWCQDLEATAAEAWDDLVEDPEATGFDLLVDFMAWATVGPAGEIVGCVASQDSAFGHADPLVRCADGRIRGLRTASAIAMASPGVGRDRAEAPLVLPVDLILERERSWGGLDARALRRRFATIAPGTGALAGSVLAIAASAALPA